MFSNKLDAKQCFIYSFIYLKRLFKYTCLSSCPDFAQQTVDIVDV